MNRLAIITLAATALVPASAIAQHSTVSPPVKWEDVPDARLRAHGPARVEMHHAPGAAPMAHAPMARRDHGGARGEIRHGNRMMHRRADRAIRRGHHGINRYPHYRRVERGVVLPHSWWGPRFHIQNWGMYGFPQPMHGNRWVRYYDDALLIDSYGRVHDGRYGMSWDEYGDQWGYDESGIPIYTGNGDFHPGEKDYAWAEDEQAYGEGYQGYGHGGGYQQQVYAHPPVVQHYPYPAYGWGYGYGAGAIITETTVTTSPTVVSETYYVDEVVTQRARKPRRAKRRVPCNCPRPAPVRPYGERG